MSVLNLELAGVAVTWPNQELFAGPGMLWLSIGTGSVIYTQLERQAAHSEIDGDALQSGSISFILEGVD